MFMRPINKSEIGGFIYKLQILPHQKLMQDEGSAKRKDRENDKKMLLSTLSQSINPLMKQIQTEDNMLQMPELALRCAQFFHSVSQYCMGYYRNCTFCGYLDKLQEESRKTKLIKKQQKEKKEKHGRGRGRRKGEDIESNVKQSLNQLQPPKKPLTAYIIYFQDKKHNFVERYPSLNLSELTKLIAKQWKELSQAEKQVYLVRAADDRKRYEEQMSQFKRLYGKNYQNDLVDVLQAKDERPAEEAELEAIINAEGIDENVMIEEQTDKEKSGKNQNDEQQVDENNEDQEEGEEQEAQDGEEVIDEEEQDSEQEQGGEQNEQEQGEGQENGQSEGAEQDSDSVAEDINNEANDS